jgi:hypothetical protein
MYSVIDKASFQRAETELARLQDWELLRSRPAILVGNKVDLVRSRAISSQGKSFITIELKCVFELSKCVLCDFQYINDFDDPPLQIQICWGSSVSIVTRLRNGRPAFDSRQGQGFSFFATASRPALGPTQTLIQWVPRAISPGVKRPGREGDHSFPSSAEVKNAWSYTSIPPICLHGMVLCQVQGLRL